jgi:mutual gliding-motility protein MglA
MPVVNPLARELVFKIVYWGPGLGGKTTTLQYVHAATKPEHRGKMVSLATPVDRTLYFDFLPIRLPTVRDMGVRLQLFTVPGQVYYNATRKLVLTGADGVVMVVDSQRARADANLESLDNLRENLREHGRSLAELPHVFQYNKRDLSGIVGVEDLEAKLNRHRVPSFASVAPRGEGVFQALEAITRSVLDDFERRVPEQRAAGGEGLGMPEGGLTEALRRADAELASQSDAPAPGAEPVRRPSGLLRISSPPETTEPERPAPQPMPRAPVAVAERSPTAVSAALDVGWHREPAPVSFSALWPSAEHGIVRELEAALGAREFESAVVLCDQLVARVLASTASLVGSTADAPRDPALVALVLGLDGARYLEFRALVHDARAGRAIDEVEALAAYAFAVEARLARGRVRG